MNQLPFIKTYRDTHFIFHVYTNDARVFDYIEYYLVFNRASRQFNPCFELTFHIEYQDREDLPPADRLVYPGGARSDNTYTGQLADKTADLIIDIEKERVYATLYSLDVQLGAIDYVLFYPCRLFLAYHNWIYTHAALVKSRTHDFVFLGPGGAGKSSTAFSLAAHKGFTQQADDMVFLHTDREHNYCMPFPTKIGFRNYALENDKRLAKEPTAFFGRKKRFNLPVSQDTFQDITSRETVILIPTYQETATRIAFEPVFDKDDIVRQIAEFSLPMCNIAPWRKQFAAACLTLLTFVKRSEVYRLMYNDALLEELPREVANRWSNDHT